MYTLLEINTHIRQVLALNFSTAIWVTAEIAQIGQSRGHFYFDLVQTRDGGDICAQAQAVLWANDHRRLSRQDGKMLDWVLREGLTVKMQVRVDFHERYGLKLQVLDIDPAFTLGALSAQRQNTLAALRAAGDLDRNKKLALPLVLQRLALISSEGAAGLQDFKAQLTQNAYGYAFACVLFQSAVQGERATIEIMQAFEQIAAQKQHFDLVVIIRGGGARLDLAAFDDLALCRMAAQMPLPILSGIGHDVDETVLDHVVFASLKTPTAVAEYIIQHNLHFETSLLQTGLQLSMTAKTQVQFAEQDILRLEQGIWSAGRWQSKSAAQRIETWAQQLPVLAQNRLKTSYQALAQAEAVCQALHPDAVLKRGFSITRKNGDALHSAERLQSGDVLETQLFEGRIISTVR